MVVYPMIVLLVPSAFNQVTADLSEITGGCLYNSDVLTTLYGGQQISLNSESALPVPVSEFLR